MDWNNHVLCLCQITVDQFSQWLLMKVSFMAINHVNQLGQEEDNKYLTDPGTEIGKYLQQRPAVANNLCIRVPSRTWQQYSEFDGGWHKMYALQ
jgi:hypothetical protein